MSSEGVNYKAYQSQVVIEPSVQAASEVVSKLSSPDWAQNCDKPDQIGLVQQQLKDTNAQTDCGLSLVAPEETQMPVANLPAGATGWQFSGTVHCNTYNTDWATGADTLVTQVGPDVIIFSIVFNTTFPDAADFQILGALAARAHAALRI